MGKGHVSRTELVENLLVVLGTGDARTAAAGSTVELPSSGSITAPSVKAL
jgi:hypothetical protein